MTTKPGSTTMASGGSAAAAAAAAYVVVVLVEGEDGDVLTMMGRKVKWFTVKSVCIYVCL